MESNDDALIVLREVFDREPLGVPWALVEQCYLIERKHRYEGERDHAVGEIRACIARFVEDSLALLEAQ